MLNLPPQCAAGIEKANQLVADESIPTIKRLVTLANGDCCDVLQDGKRIYYRAPDVVSLEHIINRALGTPGAKVIAGKTSTSADIESALSDITHELTHLDPNADPLDPEGPFRAILSAVAKRRAEYRRNQAEVQQQVIQFLPTAIERLTEMCSGVTIRREYSGKTRTYTLRPNRRAIEHISKRIHGSASPIVNSLDEHQEPNLTRQYTMEDIQKMTTTDLIALVTASEQGGKEAGKESETVPDPPAYYTDAYVQMAEFLPEAITSMKTLAQGATTIIETDTGERDEISHAPDPRANQFLIDLFIGAPSSRFVVNDSGPIDLTQNANAIAHYTDNILKLCTSHPNHAGKENQIRELLNQLTANIQPNRTGLADRNTYQGLATREHHHESAQADFSLLRAEEFIPTAP